ncbi:MAG: ABC transporter permease [Candidatus Dojkabacteria bacterium]|nr:MAG: ABC transporter permease [Candidatus Dojkabacteria bacterium]
MNSSLTHKLDLLYVLLRTGFRLRYNDSLLGVLWVVIRPLINFVVLYLVFSFFVNREIENFQVYLFSGLIIYNYFSESVLSGAGSLLGMAHIILKVQFPKEIAVLSTQGLAVISLVINLGILSVFAYVSGVNTNPMAILYFLFIMVVLTTITYGISLFTSVMSVRLRDVKNLIEVFLQIGFYLSPIIYPLDIVPLPFRTVIQYNPMTIIIQAARDAIANGNIIYVNHMMVLLGLGIFMIGAGTLFFNKMVKKVAEYY